LTLSQPAKGWLKLFATVAVSVLFFYLFLRGLDLDQVADALVEADYLYVPLALGLFALSLVVRAMRWQVFYKPDNISLRILFPAMLVTYAGNNLLPLRAGELIRAQLLMERAGLSRMRTLGTAAVERLFDILVLGGFVLFGIFLGDIGFAFVAVGLVLFASCIAGLAIACLVANRPELPGKIAANWTLLPLRWRSRLADYSEWFAGGFSVLKSANDFYQAAALTATAWLLEFGMYWLLAVAFSIDSGFLRVAFAGSAANLALSVPFSQAGIGPFQVVAKEALLRFGVAANLAAAYVLALHVLLVVPVSLAGLLVLWAMLPRRQPVVQATPSPDSPV
jgi:uncharacterized protein (TIRG00374 family)